MLDPKASPKFGGWFGFEAFGFGGDKKADAGNEKKAGAGGEKKAGAGGEKKADAGGEKKAGAGGDKTAGAGGEKKADAGGEKKAGAGNEKKADAGGEKKADAEQVDAATSGNADAPVPEMPKEFGAESVLRTWIGQFNVSLMKRVASGKKKPLEKLKQKGWADDNGLSYELLAVAAAKEPVKASGNKGEPAPTQQEGPLPAPVLNARILEMMAKGNGLLFKVITPDYAGKCMQFSQKILKEMGARRADKSDGNQEKRSVTKLGPQTAAHRFKQVKELPATLPPGYQICVTSKPEWGFTEVGNHWFVSAGDGFYFDNVMGVSSGARLTQSLIGTTGDQWASRVIDKDLTGLRAQMGEKFTKAHPEFEKYQEAGRTAGEKKEKKGKNANPDYKAEGALEAEGRTKIKAFVKGNADYHPRIWLVEPTTRAEPGGG